MCRTKNPSVLDFFLNQIEGNTSKVTDEVEQKSPKCKLVV